MDRGNVLALIAGIHHRASPDKEWRLYMDGNPEDEAVGGSGEMLTMLQDAYSGGPHAVVDKPRGAGAG